MRRLGYGGVAAASLPVVTGITGKAVQAAPVDGPSPSQSASPFQHGVASGDPLASAVIIWTRVTMASAAPVNVNWEISPSADFATITNSGVFATDAGRDYTVKIDATGLQAGTTYYYRFTAAGFTSQTGRTRTLPTGSVDRLRFAVLSCASYPHGFFNAYRRVAERQDLDCVFHLGDYVYEYSNTGYGSDVQAGGRIYDPPHEMVTLSDYRRRHAHYKKDLDLQLCHQQHPFINVWDDHEFTNDAWSGGAQNHNEGEGVWAARSNFALQAYDEWVPIRLPNAGDRTRIYRRFEFGDLVDLIMLDTRFVGRDEQLPATVVISDPVGGFTDDGGFADANRGLLGADQTSFLSDALQNATAKWKLLGQQIMFGQLKFTGLPNASNVANIGGQGGVFLNPDQWDGYPRERERVWDMIRGGLGHPNVAVNDVVVLTGDIHTCWSMDITEDPNNPIAGSGGYNSSTGEGSMAVEFVATSVSSPGLDEITGVGEPGLMTQNPHMKYINLADHGYLILDIDHSRCQGEHWLVSTVAEPSRDEAFEIAHFTNTGENHLQEAGGASDPKPNPPAFAPYGGIPL